MTGPSDGAADHVFYEMSDCAGFFRRIAATVVDLAVLLAFIVAYYAILVAFDPSEIADGKAEDWFAIVFIGVAFLYLTVLKRSRFRTLGYRLTGLRIVDLKGRPPAIARISMRLLWWVLGPINPLLDLFFMSSDPSRQTLRDKLMGTYVVRQDAEPAGTGPCFLGRMSFMGMMLMYPTVRRRPPPIPPQPVGPPP
jgi:uncharacterized RDD family membrane protein YckC